MHSKKLATSSITAVIVIMALFLTGCQSGVEVVEVEKEVKIDVEKVVEVEVQKEGKISDEPEYSYKLEEAGDTAEASDELSGEVVVVSWGGSYQAGQREAYWEPFQEETGVKVIEAESPEHARIKAQVDSGKPEWDLVTTGLSALLELGPDYFEPIAYDQYPEAYGNIPDNMKKEHGIVGATFCYGLVYRTDVFGEGEAPQTWADFWNPEQFPGPRAMALDAGVPWNSVDAAWVSAGNDGSTLPQMDLDVVFEQFDKLEPHIAKWWGSGAEALQLLASQEV